MNFKIENGNIVLPTNGEAVQVVVATSVEQANRILADNGKEDAVIVVKRING